MADQRETQKPLTAASIDPADFHCQFVLHDAEGSGQVQMHGLVDGCIRLQGGAKPLDVARAPLASTTLERKLDDLS